MDEKQGAFGEIPFSARILLWLVCDQRKVTLSLSHAGPNWVIAINPKALPKCEARVVVSIDGEELSHDVRLINGMSASETKTRVEFADVAPF